MSQFAIRPLDADTWEAFVALCDRHGGGGFGGCYCTWFHRETHGAPVPGRPASFTLDFKHALVTEGRAHAALVFDGDDAVAWAQYGSPAELPGIMHRKEVEGAGDPLPDWRITCVFVDRRYRHRGLASVAVAGALRLIAAAGGGTVESYPHDIGGTRPQGDAAPVRKMSASFLYNATRGVFEDAGFRYVRPKGKNNCIMRTWIEPTDVHA